MTLRSVSARQTTSRTTCPVQEVGETVYSAFGQGLCSSLDFPELRRSSGSEVRWRFGLMEDGEQSTDGWLLGTEPLYRNVEARLYQRPNGFRIEVDDTGIYDFSPDGSTIGWLPNPEPWWDFGRGHLLGRVLSTSMHFNGLMVLHASAVMTADGSIALLGTKGSGKTTLALSLVDAGARLVTDDTLPVSPEDCLAWPGIHSLRLTHESASFQTSLGPLAPPGRDGKIVAGPLDEMLTTDVPTNLRAIYLVEPAVSHDPNQVVARTTLDPLRATAALVAHAKSGRMLGRDQVGVLFDRAERIASRIPVRVLAVHRDTDRLSEMAQRIIEWHGGPPQP